ncbi:MAG TPA: hypothetical protein VIJ79_00170 [Acidobacteriaceae bacterium]
MLNNFIINLMRFVGGVMFFSGMAFLAYAVIGGYYHYSPLFHAVAWGFAGWILFFVGKDVLEQYKPAAQAVAPPQPPMPVYQPTPDIYGISRPATREEAQRALNVGGNNRGNQIGYGTQKEKRYRYED